MNTVDRLKIAIAICLISDEEGYTLVDKPRFKFLLLPGLEAHEKYKSLEKEEASERLSKDESFNKKVENIVNSVLTALEADGLVYACGRLEKK